MGAFACGTLKDICLPRLVLPVCLPTCLQKPLGKWRPDANPAWIGTSLLPTTHGGSGALLPYTKAPGTLHYHAMFSDWETVPWAHCTETAPPPPNRCCLISSLSSRAPGHLDRTTTTPLPLSLCVWQHSHIPQDWRWQRHRQPTPPLSSTAGVAIGEARILLLWEAPFENCGNRFL